MPGYNEDALTFGREGFGDLANLSDIYAENEIQEIKSFVGLLPTQDQISQMGVVDRKRLAEQMRWSLVYYVLSLSNPAKTQITYTIKDHALSSPLMSSIVSFADPTAIQWNDIQGTDLSLISLWQRDTQTDRILVKSVTDGRSIVFRLEWEDATKDDDAISFATFGDAAAVQFPLDPASDPFFGMGDTSFVVNIWHWKSWWQKDFEQYAGVSKAFPRNRADFYPFDVAGGSRAEYFVSAESAKVLSKTWNAGWASRNLISAQDKKSSVEDLNARGFGTLTSQGTDGQNVSGKGLWKDGKWALVFVRALQSQEKGDVLLKLGGTIPVAFAVWDGALGDRNGQKMITNWYQLTIGGK